jgi:hypothetical protein
VAGRLAVEELEKVSGDGVAGGIFNEVIGTTEFDAAAVARVMVPVKKHGRQRGEEPIGDGAFARVAVVVAFRQDAAEGCRSGLRQKPEPALLALG